MNATRKGVRCDQKSRPYSAVSHSEGVASPASLEIWSNCRRVETGPAAGSSGEADSGPVFLAKASQRLNHSDSFQSSIFNQHRPTGDFNNGEFTQEAGQPRIASAHHRF